MPHRPDRSKTLIAGAKRAGWTAAGVAFGAYAGRALGGALLGRLGADVGEFAGAAAGGLWAWQAAGAKGEEAPEVAAPVPPEAADPAAATPTVDASFTA